MNKCFNWTPERTDKLKKLWEDGLSASAIAGAFFRDASKDEPPPTRNALLGKVHRLGLSNRKSTRPAASLRKPAAPKAARPIRRPRPKPVRLPPPEPPKPYDGPSVPFLEVKDNQCKFIVSGEGMNALCCGAEIAWEASPKFCEACKVNHKLIDTLATRRSQHNYTIKRAVAA